MNILVCMLVRNERECLEIMLPKLPKAGPASGFDRIVAVDGNSSDGTPELLAQWGIETLRQRRRGRGAAYLEAMEAYDADAYLFFSPDGNEDVADFPRFRQELEKGAELVIASRMMTGAYNEEDGHFFRPRKAANIAFNVAANRAFRRRGPYITDTINGFRAIKRELARKLALDADGYTIEYQMTIRALALGANIAEFPTHEYPRVAGETGAPSIPTGIAFLKCYVRELQRQRQIEAELL